MSLLGRLEDLSLPDIVQIVYLSRRTGMLEIVDDDSRWGIFFLNGLVANAFSPDDQSVLEFLDRRQVIPGWMLDSNGGFPARHVRQVVSGREIVPSAYRNQFNDPMVIEAEKLLPEKPHHSAPTSDQGGDHEKLLVAIAHALFHRETGTLPGK